MDELLNRLSVEDIEKIKLLFSLSNNQQPKEIVTLRVFREEYLNFIKNSRSGSYYHSVCISFSYLVEFFGIQHSIQLIQQKNIESFLIFLQGKVRKGYVVYFRNLKAAFNKAKEWEYVKENFFTKVKLPKKQKLAPIFINSDQLLVICDWIKSEVVKDVVVFAFYTGMRLDEIVNLRWNNIDLQNRIITVGDEQFITKGRNQRFIPMTEEVLNILTRRKLKDNRKTLSYILPINKYDNPDTTSNCLGKEFIFCNKAGNRFTGNYFSRRFKKACIAAGLDNAIHFHSLRHSFASNLVQKGVSLYSVKELLGHSSISTTEIYSHLNMDSLREAVEKLDTSAVRQSSPHALHSAGVKSVKQDNELPLSFGHLPLCKRENSQVKIYRINSGEKR